jgi:hypothetical protein
MIRTDFRPWWSTKYDLSEVSLLTPAEYVCRRLLSENQEPCPGLYYSRNSEIKDEVE